MSTKPLSRLLNAAKTKFRHELCAFEARALHFNEAAYDYQLQTDIAIVVATNAN